MGYAEDFVGGFDNVDDVSEASVDKGLQLMDV